MSNAARRDALSLLATLRKRKRSGQRHDKLLRSPSNASEDQGSCWFFYLPPAFNEALDIKQDSTRIRGAWSQGGLFAFRAGDTIYDTSEGYLTWRLALPKISMCIKVLSAKEVSYTAKQERDPGYVKFSIMIPTEEGQALREACQCNKSQDDFVEFLICGPSEELKQQLNDSEQLRLSL
jgi:hypothetical protein